MTVGELLIRLNQRIRLGKIDENTVVVDKNLQEVNLLVVIEDLLDGTNKQVVIG